MGFLRRWEETIDMCQHLAQPLGTCHSSRYIITILGEWGQGHEAGHVSLYQNTARTFVDTQLIFVE